MVFKPRQKKENLNIKLETTQCTNDQVKEFMSIGVILNENLSWNRTLLISLGKFKNSLV